MDLHVALLHPEIPPNTGNVIRLCANTGASLHLIRPLGFTLDDRALRRAGLDYREWVRLEVHESLADFVRDVEPRRMYGFSTRGATPHTGPAYQAGDALLFGPETRGLPDAILADLPTEARVRLPMRPHNRSLNLSNAVAVAVFEVWRQWDFAGAAPGDGERPCKSRA